MRKFSKVAMILWVLVVCLASVGFSMASLIPELLNTGMQLYTAKDYAGAADYLGQVVDMVPDHDQARYYLVFSLSLAGHHDKALAHARVLKERHPEQKEYEALTKQMQQKFDSHVKATAKSRRHSAIPKSVTIGGYESLVEIREPRMSTQTYEVTRAREKTPLEKAIDTIDEAQYEQAAVQLHELLKKDSDNAEIMHYLGVVYLNQGEYTQARDWFKKAVAKDPRHFQSRFLLGDSYRATSEFEKAEEQFRQALIIKKDVFAQLNLADICMQLNKLQEAEKHYEEIISKDANILEAKLGLAQIRLITGKTEEAARMTQEVLRLRQGDPEVHHMHALILLESGLVQDARDEAKKAYELIPGSVKYHSTYALTLARAFNYQAAISEAGQILDANPDNIDARLVLAESLLMTGALNDAREHLNKIEKNQPSAQASFLRATLLTRTNMMEEAKEAFVKYVSLSAGRPLPAMRYAQFLEANGFTEEAQRAYTEITQRYPETAFATQANEAANRLGGSDGQNTTQPDSQYRPGKVKY